jgi:hypothetical protein
MAGDSTCGHTYKFCGAVPPDIPFKLDWTTASWAAQARYQSHRRPFQKGTGCCKLHI